MLLLKRSGALGWPTLRDEQTQSELNLAQVCRQHPEVARVLAEVCNGPVALRPLSILIPDLDLRQLLGALRTLEAAGVVCHVTMRNAPSPQGLAYLLSPSGELQRPHLRRLTIRILNDGGPDDQVNGHPNLNRLPAQGSADGVARDPRGSRAQADHPWSPRSC